MRTGRARRWGFLRIPSVERIMEMAGRDHLGVERAEAAELQELVRLHLEAIDAIQDLEPEAVAPQASGRQFSRPTAEEDPLNAFITVCDVAPTGTGVLSGRTVAVKDNIDVAGVPTTNGSAITPYVAARDAAVIERILQAGGRIVGKLNMDDFGTGATGEVSAFGPVLNPADQTRSSAGSSSGSGAAVMGGAVDMALAVDQAGSARLPASFTGAVTILGTHGLVPSHGVTHIDHTLDFVCPVGRTVEDAALLLGVIAGSDDRDPQWVRGDIVTHDYAAAVGQGVEGLKVGVIRQSTDPEVCQPDVLARLEATIESLKRNGAIVSEVDLPMWASGVPIALGLLCHLTGALVRAEGEGYGHLGAIDPTRLRAFAIARRAEGHRLPPLLKVRLIVSRYLAEEYLNVTYATLQNARRRLSADIDRQFAEHDLLLTPTTPMTAFPLLDGELTARDVTLISEPARIAIVTNTPQLNLSGHPAAVLPSGQDSQGLPTSVQVIGPRFAEPTVVRAAAVIEQGVV